MDGRVYVIVVPGFVPGLPERLTMAEAQALGVEGLLKGAIANKTYRVETPSLPSTEPVEEHPQLGEGKEGVNHGQ